MERDRILRVMRWVYWDPKSRIKTRSDFTALASIVFFEVARVLEVGLGYKEERGKAENIFKGIFLC